MKLFLKLLISTILSTVGGEMLLKCDDSPKNICGSDMVLYNSECDFLNAKSKNGDLLILDISDCMSVNLENQLNNIGFNNTLNNFLIVNRSLRGSIDKISPISNDLPMNQFNITNVKIEEIDNNFSLFLNNTINSQEKVQIFDYSNDNFLDNPLIEDNRLFKNVTERNVKLINVLVERFDISTFILSNGKYNLLKLSKLILDTIIKIIHEYRQNIKNRRESENYNLNTNSSTTIIQLNNLEEEVIMVSNRNATDKFENQLYDGLNITFKFSNRNITNEVPEIPYITNLALEVIEKITDKNESFYNISDLKNEETENNSNSNKYMNRSLIEVNPGDLYLNYETYSNNFFPKDEIKNSNLNNSNCNFDLQNYSNYSKNLGFHCSFRDSKINNEDKTKSISEMTELALAKYFDNYENYYNLTENYWRTLSNSFNNSLDEDIYKYIPYVRSLINPKNFNDLQIRKNFELDFLSSESSISNYIDEDLNTYELYICFDFTQMNDLYFDWNNTVNSLDKYNDILIENISSNKTLNEDNSDNYKIDKGLIRMALENNFFNKNNTDLSIENLFRNFPTAFDRKRDDKCVQKCGNEKDYHCASNGVTYQNLCEFRNAQCEDEKLIFVYYGKCLPLIIRS